MIVLEGLNPRQATIAQLLWTSETSQEVDAVIGVFGREAVSIKELIIAAAIDEDTAAREEFPEVQEFLQSL